MSFGVSVYSQPAQKEEQQHENAEEKQDVSDDLGQKDRFTQFIFFDHDLGGEGEDVVQQPQYHQTYGTANSADRAAERVKHDADADSEHKNTVEYRKA